MGKIRNVADLRIRIFFSVLMIASIAIVCLAAYKRITIDSAVDPIKADRMGNLLMISLILCLLVCSAYLILNYVRGNEESLEDLRRKTYYNDWFIKELEIFKDDILLQVGNLDNSSNIDARINSLINEKISHLTRESIIDDISQNFKKEITSKAKLSLLDEDFNEMKNRINIETARITRYAYINLLIGFVTTFGVISILVKSLLGVNTVGFTTSDYIMHFLPRVSLSILIQVFSFFFLKLYSRNLDELKYWNNERTNLEMKIVSIKAGMITENADTISDLIKTISSTERNFILKKGETTVELEKNKADDSNNAGMIAAILKLADLNKLKN